METNAFENISIVERFEKVQNILGLFMTCVTTWIHVLHSVHYVLVQVRMCCDRPLLSMVMCHISVGIPLGNTWD